MIKNSIKEQSQVMKELLNKETEEFRLLRSGDFVEGKIIEISKTVLTLDLGHRGTGVVYGAELKESKDTLKDLKIGDTLSALVINSENEDGYVELSLKEASLEKTWQTLKQKKQDEEIVTVKIIEANRGGLVINLSGIIGFLPVSQLSSQNYPRIKDGNKDKVLEALNHFINQEMKVKIINLDRQNEQIIVSERALDEEKIKENLKGYKKGDIIEGTASQVTDFGAFVKFGPDLEGLIHISELDWAIIGHPSEIIKEDQPIKAQIIDIQKDQVSLSLKSLKKDPWHEAEQKYQVGQTINGQVIKFNPFGAFVQIDKNIYGLAHISELANQEKPAQEVFKIGQSYNFEILSLDPKEHKISLKIIN